MKDNFSVKPMMYSSQWFCAVILFVVMAGVFSQKAEGQPPIRDIVAEHIQDIRNTKDVQLDKVLVTVDFNNTSLDDAILELGLKSGVTFNYSGRIFPGDTSITYRAANKPVSVVLQAILPEGITYVSVRDIVILRQSAKPDFEDKQEMLRETVNGTVTDADTDEALPGVNVIVVGTDEDDDTPFIGTTTDLNGYYSLSVPDSYDQLAFTYIGYVRQVVKIDDRNEINISMQPDIYSGGELVVVGYGTQRERDLTGSIASVNSERISSLPVPSISDAIQGQATGVQVVSTGTPGSDATFRIRGTGTIGNSNPLIVIDGFPTRSGLNQLNPNDIESVQILKDASASAIYGAQGANGVIIVTTKRGGDERGSLTIDIRSAIQQPAGTIDMLNASQFALLHNDMMINNGLNRNPDFLNPADLGGGTNWLDEMFRNSLMQNYTVSYSWGNDSANIYASGGVLRQDGTIIETAFNRYNIQFNTDVRVLENLRFGNSLTLNHDEKPSGSYSITDAMAALPTQPIYNPDGTYAGPVGQPSFVGDVTNPVGQAKLIENNTKGYNVIGSVFGELDIMENLQFRSNAGLQLNHWDSETWSPAYDWQPNPNPHHYLSQSYNKSLNWLWDNTLTYDSMLGLNHSLNVVAGTSAQHNRFDNMYGSVMEFSSDRTRVLSSGQGDPTLGGNANEWAILSFFGRANYSYKDKYLFTATVRRDGSSRFGEGNRWGTFPSGSFAWRISEEDFFRANDLFDELKFRISYGLTGNQEIGNYSFASELDPILYTFNNNTFAAVAPERMANPFIQWETVEQFNFGADISLLNNRLNMSIDAYLKNTRDMLVPMSVPIQTGYSDQNVPDINAGKIENRGVELNVNSRNISTDRFSWTTDFNISYNRNEVISLNDTIPLPTGTIDFNYTLQRFQAGQPVNAFFGFVTDGIFQNQAEVDAHAAQQPGSDPYNRTAPGDIRFVDLNGDGVINDDDRTFLGDPNPTFIFALGNNFLYKNIDVSIFLQGVYGNDIFNANRIWTEGMSVAQNQTTATLNRWTGEGTSNSMPRAVFNDPNGNNRVSDRYIEDGSYLRIKNVTVGYTLPADHASRFNIRNVRIYASANNLLTLTNYSGMDPEVPFHGRDLNLYPVSRTISLGVNLRF